MVIDVPLRIPTPLIPRVLTNAKTLYVNNTNSMNKKYKKNNANIVTGGKPSYLMIGGLLFVPLTKEYLNSEFKIEDGSEYHLTTNEFQLISLADKSKNG